MIQGQIYDKYSLGRTPLAFIPTLNYSVTSAPSVRGIAPTPEVFYLNLCSPFNYGAHKISGEI